MQKSRFVWKSYRFDFERLLDRIIFSYNDPIFIGTIHFFKNFLFLKIE